MLAILCFYVWYCWLIVLRFGLTGLSRPWIVNPAALTWPTSLSSTVLFRVLREPKSKKLSNGWSIALYHFCPFVTLLTFVAFWFPDYIWTSLSPFAFITWLALNNQKVNTMFRVRTLHILGCITMLAIQMNSGLGLLPIRLDWTQINYAGHPLTTPLYSICNAVAVVVLLYFFLSPTLYYATFWYSA